VPSPETLSVILEEVSPDMLTRMVLVTLDLEGISEFKKLIHEGISVFCIAERVNAPALCGSCRAPPQGPTSRKGMRIQPRKVASDYAFSAVTPSRYSSDRLTIIDSEILLFECSYFQTKMIT
jgi:hypothetical protein